MVHLLPLAQDELLAVGDLPTTLDEFLYKGSYPPIYTRPVDAFQWYANYVSTYLERDVRQLINVQDLVLFQRFLRVCAHHVGQLVNMTQIANDCGISQKTVEAWLSVLEASYLVVRLQPWYRNFNKRLVKTPKLYFYDTGLVCWLLGIREVEQVKFHAMRGALFENLVISECHKYLFNQGEHPEIWFWRDRSGHEVDMVLERDGQCRQSPVGLRWGAGTTAHSGASCAVAESGGSACENAMHHGQQSLIVCCNTARGCCNGLQGNWT